jgi:hypothetical protein
MMMRSFFLKLSFVRFVHFCCLFFASQRFERVTFLSFHFYLSLTRVLVIIIPLHLRLCADG